MRLLTYEDRGAPRVGLIVGDKVADLSRLAAALGRETAIPVPLGSMRDLIQGWDRLSAGIHAIEAEACRRADELSSLLRSAEDVVFLPPVPPPLKNVMCMGLNYRDHVQEGIRAKAVPKSAAEHPYAILFTKAPSTLIGHMAGIPKHACTAELDYEAELAVIIGRRGRDIPREKAYDYVFGYCCANDISARDLQRRHNNFKGKTLDGSCPLGPFLVPREDYGDPMNVRVRCWVNGDLRQDAGTSLMIHDIPAIISVLSEGFTLDPGDVVLTGTPAGVGYARRPSLFLQVEDWVEVEVEGLGRLKNKVVEPTVFFSRGP